jgi:plasmid segregation protein ParM
MNEQETQADTPLETVRTETLPEGALFVSPDGVLYQVVMAGSAGFRKAEPWPWPAHAWLGTTRRPTAVALVAGSLLARNYPVVTEGRPLRTLSRSDFLGSGDRLRHYVFPDERLARLAAQLDESLAPKSGLAVRKEGQRYVLSDGQYAYRTYHYQVDDQGQAVDPTARRAEEILQAQACEQGPHYWRYIPGWEETLSAAVQPAQPSPEPSLESAIEKVIAEVVAIAQEPTPSPAPERAEAQPEHKEERKEPLKEEKVEPKTQTRREPKAPRRRTLAMILSLDIGYGYTKGVGPDGLRFSFPSVIGNAEDVRFAANLISGERALPVQYNDRRFFYGKQAVLQSRIQSAIFDRSRIHDQTYKMLFVAALVEAVQVNPDSTRVKVVTGLPVGFFGDRDDVIKAFEGTHQVTADRPLKFAVESVYVAPQPFGSLFRELLNDQGKIVNNDVERGRIGVIDVGTFTTDFVVSDELRYVQRLSGSIPIGWGQVASQVQQALGDLLRLELLPHEVDQAVQAMEVRVRGEPVSLEPLVEPVIAEIRTAVIARARDLWGEAAQLDAILVSGGGGPYLYDAIHGVYPHARLLDNAFWANAEGLYRFGQRPATFEK